MFSNLEYNISITKLFPYIIYQAHQQLYTVIVMGTSIGEHLFKPICVRKINIYVWQLNKKKTTVWNEDT